MTDDPHAALVALACAGDAAALEQMIEAVQDRIYGLAVRMLWHPEDARDATQEILIRIVTHLGSYRGESRFSTWCLAVAANYLRTARRSRVEQQGYTFESFEAELHEPTLTDEETERHPEYAAAVEEVKVGCTLGMLLCLDRQHRLAYILGEILELDHNEGAAISGTTAAAFRQRLSRARKSVASFTARVCGIVDERNACRCASRACHAIGAGRVRLGSPLFGPAVRETARRFGDLEAEVRRLETLRRAAALYRAHPPFTAPDELKARVMEILG